jgi:hypothetical protein
MRVLLQKSETEVGAFQDATTQRFHADDAHLVPNGQGKELIGRVAFNEIEGELKGLKQAGFQCFQLKRLLLAATG